MRVKSFARAGSLLVLVAALSLSGGAAFAPTTPAPTVVNAAAPLTELAPAADPLDGASAHFIAIASNGRTRAILILTGISPSAVGSTFGAHVHIGTCVAGNGAAARGHYNTGGAPSRTTEVWLDFTVRPGGVAVSKTRVPFVIPQGAAHALVIHAMPTAPNGSAGARLACLPIAF